MSAPTIDQVHIPIAGSKKKKRMPTTITKIDAKRGLVYGWASITAKSDGSPLVDRDGDTIPTDVLQDAMLGFMEDYRAGGVMHEGDAEGVVVESLVVTAEKLEAMGIPAAVAQSIPEGAFIGLKLDPTSETFKRVESGELGMFSIFGKAVIAEAE